MIQITDQKLEKYFIFDKLAIIPMLYSKLYLRADLLIPKKIEENKEFKQIMKTLLFLVDHAVNLKLSPQVFNLI